MWLIRSFIMFSGVLLLEVTAMSLEEVRELRDEVHEMFTFTYDSYKLHAFPYDELLPISCKGEDTLGGYALTLVDSMDMLAMLGNATEFSWAVKWLGQNLDFNLNKTVSLFETNIRIMGGLLASHLLASDKNTGMQVQGYNGELLAHALDLGSRLLPTFNTPTGIPYGSVNLRHGVEENESKITCTAAATTLAIEFATLSRLTGNSSFEEAARTSLRAVWERRSKLDLVGAHINIFTGDWTQAEAGIGTSIDSFYEYLLKAYVLLGDEEYLEIFHNAYAAAERHLRRDPWYVEVNMFTGSVVWPVFNSLQAFWPGLQVLAGDVQSAVRTHRAFFSVWQHYGFTPEGFNLVTNDVQEKQASYPLRPELAESTYYLYKATLNPHYLKVGRDMVTSLQLVRAPCGYAMVEDVRTHATKDTMESFFLAETLRYLYLLFDFGYDRNNLAHSGPYSYVFSTEGHMFPVRPDISRLDQSTPANSTPANPAENLACSAVSRSWELNMPVPPQPSSSSAPSLEVNQSKGVQAAQFATIEFTQENGGGDDASMASLAQAAMAWFQQLIGKPAAGDASGEGGAPSHRDAPQMEVMTDADGKQFVVISATVQSLGHLGASGLTLAPGLSQTDAAGPPLPRDKCKCTCLRHWARVHPSFRSTLCGRAPPPTRMAEEGQPNTIYEECVQPEFFHTSKEDPEDDAEAEFAPDVASEASSVEQTPGPTPRRSQQQRTAVLRQLQGAAARSMQSLSESNDMLRDVRNHKDVLNRIGFHGMLDHSPTPPSSQSKPQPHSGPPPLSTKELVDMDTSLGLVPVQRSQQAQGVTRSTRDAAQIEQGREPENLQRSLDMLPHMQQMSQAIHESLIPGDGTTVQAAHIDEHGRGTPDPLVSSDDLGLDDQQIRRQQAVHKASELIQKHRDRILSSRAIDHATSPSRQQLVRNILQRKREEMAIARKPSPDQNADEVLVDNPREATETTQEDNHFSSQEAQQKNIDNRHEDNGVSNGAEDAIKLKTSQLRQRQRVESEDRHAKSSRLKGRLSGWRTDDSLIGGDSMSRSQRRAFGTKKIVRSGPR